LTVPATTHRRVDMSLRRNDRERFNGVNDADLHRSCRATMYRARMRPPRHALRPALAWAEPCDELAAKRSDHNLLCRSGRGIDRRAEDRKSTRLNSSHDQ